MIRLGVLLALVTWIAVTAVAAQDRGLEINPDTTVLSKPLDGLSIFVCNVPISVGPEANSDLQWWFRQNGRSESDKKRITSINSADRLYIENNGKQSLKLYITRIMNSDAGAYTCEGIIDGARVSKTINLALFKDITFDHAPSPQHPKIYSDAKIACVVSGQPAPEVSWRRGDQVITTGGRYVTEADGLRIMNISEADNARYTCRAEVAADGRFDMRPIDVIVHIPPKVTQGPGQLEGIEQHEVSLTCAATGKPDAKWEFFKDGNTQPLSSTERRIVDADAGVIHFRPLHRDDDGDYKCTARNDVGEDSADGTLFVTVPPKIYEYRDVVGDEGKGTSLICRTEGNPPPKMVFRKVGNSFDYEEGPNENGRINVEQVNEREARLTINQLAPADTANYTCTCTNAGGMHHLNATLTVHYVPRFGDDHVSEVFSWAGKTRNMTCHAMAEPAPLIKWYLFGRVLQNNETYRIYEMGRNSALQITVREEDQGWIYSDYTCSATNDKGTGEHQITLKRATVPDAPTDITSKDESPTTVTLEVTPPEDDGGVEIYAYRVEYEQHVQDFKLGDEIRIENLRPSTEYVFRVRAKNEVGVGNPKEFRHRTDDIRVPYPIVITSDPVGNYPYEYTVQWEKPKTGGLPIKEYRFKHRRMKMGSAGVYEPIDEFTIQFKEDDPEAPMLYYRLQGLKPDTHYQIEVQARNDIGWSDQNSQFIFQTDEGNDAAAARSRPGMGTAAVIAIVVGVFFIFLIIVDISCYFINSCGVLMCICVTFCGRRPGDPAAAKEKHMEEGERLMGKPSPNNSRERQAPIEEARVAAADAAETHAAAPPPPAQQRLEEEQEEEDAQMPQEDENQSRRSRPISHLSENNERWKDVVQELERELRPNAASSDEKEDLKDDDDVDEKTPLQTEAKC